MNILICDDDKLYIDMIRKYVDEFFADHKITDYKVYEYNSGDEAAKNNEKIDIAFLDVEMDGINGIEAGKCLRNNNKNIVLFIITSYMGYLDDAMDEGVFRYINKPLERPVIMRGLHKALLLCSKSQSKKINIDGKWYIYYAADDGNSDNHQMYVLENTNKDPFKGEFVMKGRISTDKDNNWAIDGSVFENRG